MNKNYRSTRIVAILIIFSGCLSSAAARATHYQADQILKNMGEYLKTASEFSFHADITYEFVYAENEKIQYGAATDISLLRPQYARSDYTGDERTSQIFFNGEEVTYFDINRMLYGVVKSPGQIDKALDHMLKDYRLTIPVADLLYSDPYAVLTEDVTAGSLVGVHSCGGQHQCHHLAFTQETINWQIWIEDGPLPLPRKLVVTYKLEPGSPQFVARLSNWNFKPGLSKSDFNFNPPTGASEIKFLDGRIKESTR